MNHIVIIGFMGSGKTRVGKRLAKDLGLPFIDVDRLIVKRQRTEGNLCKCGIASSGAEPEISPEYGNDHLSEGICCNVDQTSGRK